MASKPTSRLDEARERLAESVQSMDEWDVKAQSLPEDAKPEEITFVREAFEASQRENQRWQETVDRLTAIEKAKAEVRARQPEEESDDKPEARRIPAGDSVVKREEKTYTLRSAARGVSFFRDLIHEKGGDVEARERLARHAREIQIEQRDLTTIATDGGGFIPPAYLGELFADKARAGRPFANAVPTRPLMATGMSITIPRITTGTTVGIQGTHGTENAAVSETDIVETVMSVPVRTIAGQQDVSQQLFDRSDPGIDHVIFADLRSAYDTELDRQLLNGAGTFGTHLGIRSVSSVNTVTYTDSSPTAAEHVPPMYDAIQKIWSNRFMAPDTIVMHPRRSAFLASNLSSTFPLFQLGSLNQAAGSQDVGLVNNFAGLRTVMDANVRTTDGSSTNQDEIYVVRAADMILWEGPLQARVYPDVGSGTLTVRLSLFGYSAFAAGRYPASITVISGTGLTAPSFS